MDDCFDESSDTSNSNKTIVIETDEIDNILKKYNSEDFMLPSASKQTEPSESCKYSELTSKKKLTSKNFYSLDDVSDDELNNEPLEKRLGSKSANSDRNNPLWQHKFSTEDFFEDSNDMDAVLNRISQLESEQFQDRPPTELSKEIEILISGDIIERPKSKDQITDGRNAENSFKWNGSSEEEKSNTSDLDKLLRNDFKFDMKMSEAESLKSGNSSVGSSPEDILEQPKTKRLKKIKSADNEVKQLEKEMAKAAKAKEREQRKNEKENQKQLKNALRVIEKCVKPDQCIDYITVNIDEHISQRHYGEVIKVSLKNGGYNYKVSPQRVPNLISWTRKVPTLENMLLQNIFQQEKHYLLVMETAEFIEHIVKDTLVGHIQSLFRMPDIQHLSIAILGLQRYYRYLKEEKNKEFKAAVAESAANTKTTNTEFKDLPKTSKKEIDMKLVELQIFCKNIYIRPVEKYEDLAVFVGECTKSVAQIPYKLAKAQPLQQESEFFTVNNRDCVRVDKDGNGLGRLWNQFLKMFPLASLETAEAVSSVYPTMQSLMESNHSDIQMPKQLNSRCKELAASLIHYFELECKKNGPLLPLTAIREAYKKCKTSEDAEKLIQDLPVRRAAGPLGGHRKIGPEFSRKAYKFFCSEENILL